MTTATSLLEFPKEIRREILDRLPLRTCLTMPSVCKLFLAEVGNDFFKTRCLAHFQDLKELPNFLYPLTEGVEKPWAWIAYSLVGVRVNSELLPVAKKLAVASEAKFTAHIAKQKTDLTEAQVKLKGHLGLSAGTSKEIKAKAKESEKAFEAWLETTDGKEAVATAEALTASGLVESYKELIQSTTVAIAKKHNEMNIHPIDSEVLRLDRDVFLAQLKETKDDPQLLKFAELMLQGSRFHLISRQLEMVKTFGKYMEVFPELEKKPQLCSTAIFYNIMCLLPHMRNWMPSFTRALKLHEALFEPADVEAPEPLMNLIDALPQPIPEIIKSKLVSKHGAGVLDHLEDYSNDLKELFKEHCDVFFILRRWFFQQKQIDLNPIFGSLMRSAIKGLHKRDHLKLAFRYPVDNPDLEKLREKPAAAVVEDTVENPDEIRIIEEKGWDSDDSSFSD